VLGVGFEGYGTTVGVGFRGSGMTGVGFSG